MKKGDIIFSRSNSPLSKLIQYFDGKWSHVSVYLGNGLIIDSRFPLGVQVRIFDLEDYEVISADADIDKAMEWIGYRYDLSLFLWLSFRWGKPWDTPDEAICNELVIHALNKPHLSGLTPNELYKELKN